MNISAVNCTPIKPNVSFGDVEHTHKQLHDMADEFSSSKEEGKKSDVKKPLAIVMSLAALVGIAYGGGKKAASAASAVYKKVVTSVGNVAKSSTDDVAGAAKNSDLGLLIENGLKKASSIATSGIGKLKVTSEKELTKSEKVRNATAKVLEKGLNLAKTGYKKIAYSGIADDIVGAERAQKAFENIAGAVGLATFVPEIVSRDADGDGTKDILQNSQNAYTKAEEKLDQVHKDLGVVTDVIQMLS